jgi:hypothetical protein
MIGGRSTRKAHGTRKKDTETLNHALPPVFAERQKIFPTRNRRPATRFCNRRPAPLQGGKNLVDISKANVYISGSAGATVAQSVEHLTRNEDVRGSIPRGGSNNFKHLRALAVFPLPQKSPKSVYSKL